MKLPLGETAECLNCWGLPPPFLNKALRSQSWRSKM